MCPPNVVRAQDIERQINNDVAMRELSDAELAEVNGDDDAISISSDDDEVPVQPPVNLKAHIVRADDPLSMQRTKPTQPNHGLDIMDKLTEVLDPAHQQVRDDDQSRRGFEQAQYLAIMTQLRDSQVCLHREILH